MHSITLLTVGSLKTQYLKEGCEDYIGRLKKYCNFSVEEVSASTNPDPVKQSKEESDALLSRLEKIDGAVWCFDERGKSWSSPKIATEIESLKDLGVSLTVVVGGAFGFDERVREKADKVVSLGAIVLPHELCRLVVLEQLFRGQEILRGSGYHH